MIQVNVPYRKKLDENGILLNPIDKSYPGLNMSQNRADRRLATGRRKDKSSTKIGEGAVYTIKNMKFKKYSQPILDKETGAVLKQIIHYN